MGFVAGIAATLIGQVAILKLTSINDRRQLALELLPEIRQNVALVDMFAKIADDVRRTGHVLDSQDKPVGRGLDFSRYLGRPLQTAAYSAARGRLGVLPAETVNALTALYSDLETLQSVLDRKAEWETNRDFMFQRSLEFAEAAQKTAKDSGVLGELERVAAGGWARWLLP